MARKSKGGVKMSDKYECSNCLDGESIILLHGNVNCFHWIKCGECGSRHAYESDYETATRKPITYLKNQITELQRQNDEYSKTYDEAYGQDDTLPNEELRKRLRVMHNWVKLHQYGVTNSNKIKNMHIDENDNLKRDKAILVEALEFYTQLDFQPNNDIAKEALVRVSK
jgi:hypothetical protein